MTSLQCRDNFRLNDVTSAMCLGDRLDRMGQGRWVGAPEGHKQHGLCVGLPVERGWG